MRKALLVSLALAGLVSGCSSTGEPRTESAMGAQEIAGQGEADKAPPPPAIDSPMDKALADSNVPSPGPEAGKADTSSKYRSTAPKEPALIPLEQAAAVLAHQLQATKFGHGAFGSWISGVAHLFTMDCAKAATGAPTYEQAVTSLPIAPDLQVFVLGHDLAEQRTVSYATPGDLATSCRELASHGFKPECTPDVLDVNGEGHTHLFLHMGDQLNVEGVFVRCALGRGSKTLRGAPLVAAQPYKLAESEMRSVQLDGIDGAARKSADRILLYTVKGDEAATQTTGQLWVQTTLPVANQWMEFSVTARPRR